MNAQKLTWEINCIIQDEIKTKQIIKLLQKYKKEDENKKKEKILYGIKEAQKKGVKFGRPKKKIPNQFDKVYELYINRQISSRSAAKMLGVAQSTFLKWSNARNESH